MTNWTPGQLGKQSQFKPNQSQFQRQKSEFSLIGSKFNFQAQKIDGSVQISKIAENVCFSHKGLCFLGDITMKTVLVNVLLIAIILVSGCSKGESYVRAGYDFSKLTKVAVVDVAGVVEGDAAKNQIADFFGMELLKKGYTVVERAQVQALLDEQDFQASDLTQADDAVRAGRLLNVPVVLVVNIPRYDEDMSMKAKMIDVEDASILWMGSASGTTGKTLATIFGAAAGAAAGAGVAGEGNELAGGIIGGVLGGVAGNALSPQQAEHLQKMAKKMCKDLPMRFGQ